MRINAGSWAEAERTLYPILQVGAVKIEPRQTRGVRSTSVRTEAVPSNCLSKMGGPYSACEQLPAGPGCGHQGTRGGER